MTDGGGPPAGTGGRPPSARAALNLLSTAGNLEYDRVLFFSDAVFAIAITLLVVDIRVPNLPPKLVQAGPELHAAVPRIVGFGISFAVIGLFWMSHHGMFRHITALDRVIIPLNLVFLGTIAFLPYPTALLAGTATKQVVATVFYASCVAFAALTELAIWLYAIRADGLVPASVSRGLRRYIALRMLRVPVVFGLSIPVAFVAPGVAQLLWILVAVTGVVMRRTMLREETNGADA
jgi:uncharacterized membrane protein